MNNHTTPDCGGGYFITTAADNSPMALHGKVPRKLCSRFAMANWKRLLAEDLNLPTPRAGQAATPATVITLVVLIGSCVAMTLTRLRKRWLKFN